MNRWLKSLERNRLSSIRKNEPKVVQDFDTKFYIRSYGGKHTISGPYATYDVAEAALNEIR